MKYYYLDSSAWVKSYYRESGTDLMQNLFLANVEMVCSSFGIVEVWSALIRKAKSLKTPSLVLQEKLEALEKDWDCFYEIRLREKLIEEAKGVARKYVLRGADAIHLASALAFKKRINKPGDQLIFVCSDLELKKASLSAKLDILDPEESI